MTRKGRCQKYVVFVDVKYKVVFGKESLFATRGDDNLVLVAVLDNDKAFCAKCCNW